ncbi:hypothetical protein MKEN_01482400 [Mycena kentingensis (nom. inval.)]|nr:hypothetical protein MKEN_01482400 [Mycena kentingensis (nom. inval.)]
MSTTLLCLAGTDVLRVSDQFSPEFLQSLMATVFSRLSNSDPTNSAVWTPPRISIPMPAHTALFMPSRIASDSTTGGTAVKIVSVPTSPTDARGLPASTLVLDEETGAVKAIVNAANLTALRNAAGSLLSCNLVGPHAPTNIVVFGAGAQIAAHLDIFLRAFPSFKHCTIVNRNLNERADKLAERVRTPFPSVNLNVYIDDAESTAENAALRSAIIAAQVVICATSSTIPLFPSSSISDGTHIILIGSYKPTMHEVDGALIERALPSRLIVDSREACAAEAGEIIAANLKHDQLVEMGDLVQFDTSSGELYLDPARKPLEFVAGSTSGPVTIFKSVGVGIQDVAIACAVVQRAEEMGLGTNIPWD